MTPIYIAWKFKHSEVVKILAPFSSKKLNIQLANENGDKREKSFF